MKQLVVLVAAVIGIAGHASSVLACHVKCDMYYQPNATVRRCDIECDPLVSTCSAPSGCDQCGTDATPSTPDGICTICVPDNAVSTVNGSNGKDLICLGRGGPRTVDAKGNDDVVGPADITDTFTSQALGTAKFGENFNGGFEWPLANTTVLGGSGNDWIVTGRGDDVVNGEGGSDTLVACGGRNEVHGGSGDDTLFGSAAYGCAAANDVVGSLWCGEGDDDTINAFGPAQQCMDGGTHNAGGGDTCTYVYNSGGRTQTSLDLGTARSCESTNVTQAGEPCGCQ